MMEQPSLRETLQFSAKDRVNKINKPFVSTEVDD
jgi:hypothetical protein